MTTGASPEDLLNSFRNSYNPRIAVTVDMIATGTDVKPLECLLFMRNVNSAGYFEQMKGRGVRVIDRDDLQSVTPDAKDKTPLRDRRCGRRVRARQDGIAAAGAQAIGQHEEAASDGGGWGWCTRTWCPAWPRAWRGSDGRWTRRRRRGSRRKREE